MSFEKLKKSLAALKGHYGIIYKSFMTLLTVQPQPTKEVVDKSYLKLQERYDKLFNAYDEILAHVDDDNNNDGTFDAEKVRTDFISQYEKLLSEQSEVERKYVACKEKCQPIQSNETVVTPVERPSFRLTALSSPSWNGVKADLYLEE